MSARAAQRLQDMKTAIRDIRDLLAGHDASIIVDDRFVRAAFERFLEILSEASRGVPSEWKDAADPTLAWKQVADLGNHLRHVYHDVDPEILWNIYARDLGPLERAVNRMILASASSGDSNSGDSNA